MKEKRRTRKIIVYLFLELEKISAGIVFAGRSWGGRGIVGSGRDESSRGGR
jgi:hypothetical protein